MYFSPLTLHDSQLISNSVQGMSHLSAPRSTSQPVNRNSTHLYLKFEKTDGSNK